MNEKTPDIKSSLPPKRNWIDHIIWFCLNNKLIVFLLIIFFVGWGIMVAPFDWNVRGLPRDPVPVDAIPDLSDVQVIIYTEPADSIHRVDGAVASGH